MGKSAPQSDLYAVLRVHPRAEAEVIEAAYRALSASYPPSGAKNDPSVAIAEAYDTLADPDKRDRYDAVRSGKIKDDLVGEYRFLEEIAEGGFGKTFKAEHVMLGELVCIKQCSRISPQADAILVAEAKAMWDLRHYSIPSARTVMRLDDGSLALVMSYIPGATLAQYVEKHGRMKPEHVAWITERSLNALMYLHDNGVVHGDFKPQNIIVQDKTHTVVLVDFGISLVKPTKGTRSKGYTDLFAPPEQLAGNTIIPESDFYSLGVTMLYALCGGDLGRVERREIPKDVPDPLRRFIARLLVSEPLERPRWENENLFETIQKVRQQAFGRTRTGMEPLPQM